MALCKQVDFMVIASRQKLAALGASITLSVNGISLSQVCSVKSFRVNKDENLTWENHVESIRLKVSRNITTLRRLKPI